MPTIYFEYQYSLSEARPRSWSFSEKATIPGTDRDYLRWGNIFDASESGAPGAGHGPNAPNPWIYHPDNGYDYYERSIGRITTIKPEGGSGKAPGFEKYSWQPNRWGQAFLDDAEYAQLVETIPPDLDELGGFTERNSGALFSPFFGGLGERAGFFHSAPSIGPLGLSAGVEVEAKVSFSLGGINLLGSPAQTMTDAAWSLLKYASAGVGLSGFYDAVRRVDKVRDALFNVHSQGLDLIEKGIGEFETLDAEEYNALADQFLRQSQKEFLDTARSFLPLNSQPLAELIGGVTIVAGPLEVNSRIEARIGVEGFAAPDAESLPDPSFYEANSEGGFAILAPSVSSAFGSDQRDVMLAQSEFRPLASLYKNEPSDDLFAQLGDGDDVFMGGFGHEIILGELGNDSLLGGGGFDVLEGQEGNDTLSGGRGNDALAGGPGDDMLRGGPGRDQFWASEGQDTVDGGAGWDELDFRPLEDRGLLDDLLRQRQNEQPFGADNNVGVRVDLALGVAEISGLLSMVTSSIEEIEGTKLDDILIGDGAGNYLDGQAGNDTIEGGAGNDLIRGRSGNDLLSGGDQAGLGSGARNSAIDDFGANAGGWSSQRSFPRLMGDIDGDGAADVVGFGARHTFSAVSDGNGTFDGIERAVANFSKAQGWADNDTFPRLLGDLNGDGLADIVGFGAKVTFTALATGDGGFGDFQTGVVNFALAQGWKSDEWTPRVLADVNGDRLVDIVGFGAKKTFTALSNGDGTFGSVQTAVDNFSPAQGWSGNDRFLRTAGDVNGDGLADIIGFGAKKTFTALSRGDGTFQPIEGALGNFAKAQGWISNDATPRMTGDMNGDGLSDLVGFGGKTAYAALAVGDGSFGNFMPLSDDFNRFTGWTSLDTMPRHLADLDGNGTADLVGFSFEGVRTRLVESETDLFVFDDGFGNDVVTDFATGPGGDRLDFRAHGTFNSLADVLAAATQEGSDTLITDAENSVLLVGVAMQDLTEADFIFG